MKIIQFYWHVSDTLDYQDIDAGTKKKFQSSCPLQE